MTSESPWLAIQAFLEAAHNWVLREDGNVDTGGRKIIDAGMTGENFGGWWETLPEKEQIKSIGEIRTRLIREGKLKFSDLVDKKTGKVFTLEDLGFTEGGKELNREKGGSKSGKTQVFGLKPDKKEKFIEELTGASGEVPASLLKRVKQINPNYDPDVENEYSRNCQRCYVAFELASRGHNVEAMGNPYPDRSGTSKRVYFSGWECFKKADIYGTIAPEEPKKPERTDKVDENTLVKILRDMDEGARVGIICPLKDNQSHAIVAVKFSGRIYFLDPQKGKIGNDCLPKEEKRAGYTYFRMDNLELKDNFEWTEIIRKIRK